MIIKAALTEKKDLAFQAFINDPTNHLAIDTAWEFFNRMLEGNRQYLRSMAGAT